MAEFTPACVNGNCPAGFRSNEAAELCIERLNPIVDAESYVERAGCPVRVAKNFGPHGLSAKEVAMLEAVEKAEEAASEQTQTCKVGLCDEYNQWQEGLWSDGTHSGGQIREWCEETVAKCNALQGCVLEQTVKIEVA